MDALIAQLQHATDCVLRLRSALPMPEPTGSRLEAVERLLRAGPDAAAPPAVEAAVAEHAAALEALRDSDRALELRALHLENRVREVHELADKVSIRADAQLARILELEQRADALQAEGGNGNIQHHTPGERTPQHAPSQP